MGVGHDYRKNLILKKSTKNVDRLYNILSVFVLGFGFYVFILFFERVG